MNSLYILVLLLAITLIHGQELPESELNTEECYPVEEESEILEPEVEETPLPVQPPKNKPKTATKKNKMAAEQTVEVPKETTDQCGCPKKTTPKPAVTEKCGQQQPIQKQERCKTTKTPVVEGVTEGVTADVKCVKSQKTCPGSSAQPKEQVQKPQEKTTKATKQQATEKPVKKQQQKKQKTVPKDSKSKTPKK